MEILLVRYGEIGVKGNNKYLFENRLVKNIKDAINDKENIRVEKSQSRIYVKPINEVDLDAVIKKVQKVFGIVEVCRVLVVESDIDVINNAAKEYFSNFIKAGQTFKVQTNRADKRFPLNSIETSRTVGGFLLENISDIIVDVHKPEVTLKIEIREETYIYTNSNTAKGLGGMPVGTNGRGVLMLSGGIDSPAAGYMIAKRGVEIDCVHFMSPPYTSDRAKEKVIELAKIVSQYAGNMKLYLVPFTDIQMAIYEKCPDNQITIIMRRYMMIISEIIAKRQGAMCLISGESIGQVASQTLQSLYVTNESVDMPVYRPFIGFDKQEIIDFSQKIGTYETSILPYEDCCTVFVPKHPETKPKLEYIKKSEMKLKDDIDDMIEKALNDMEVLDI